MNLLLVRNGYPPVVIRKRIWTQYLRAMRRADRDEYAPLAGILARAVKESLDRSLLPNLAGPARLLPLSALGHPGFTVRTLRAAAERDTLRARRDQIRRWLSSGRWVEAYRATRRSDAQSDEPQAKRAE